MEEKSSPRVRIHFDQTAKGVVLRDVTAEAETVEEAAKLLTAGVDALEAEVKARGLRFADHQA